LQSRNHDWNRAQYAAGRDPVAIVAIDVFLIVNEPGGAGAAEHGAEHTAA
jgi:hypothetical protein